MKFLFPFSIFRVEDHSMKPNFNEGDYVVISRWYKKPKSGDVIVFSDKESGRHMIKRIERIDNFDYIFVVGDNSEESVDSRSFGAISNNSIVGKVIFRI